MSDSLINKSTVVLNAIAITTALAVISGHVSLGFLPKLPANANLSSQRSQLLP